MLNKIRGVLVFLILILWSCSRAYYKPEDLQQLKWLEGNWVSEEAGVTMIETWKYDENKNIYYGKSVIVIGRDTVYIENQFLQYVRGRRIELQGVSGIFQTEQQEPLQVRKLKRNKLELINETRTRVVRYSLKNKRVLHVRILEIENGQKKGETQKYQKKIAPR